MVIWSDHEQNYGLFLVTSTQKLWSPYLFMVVRLEVDFFAITSRWEGLVLYPSAKAIVFMLTMATRL